MDYYERKSRARMDIIGIVEENEQTPYPALLIKIQAKYALGDRFVKGILQPMLDMDILRLECGIIYNDALKKRKGEFAQRKEAVNKVLEFKGEPTLKGDMEKTPEKKKQEKTDKVRTYIEKSILASETSSMQDIQHKINHIFDCGPQFVENYIKELEKKGVCMREGDKIIRT